jgi:hypothetical protein
MDNSVPLYFLFLLSRELIGACEDYLCSIPNWTCEMSTKVSITSHDTFLSWSVANKDTGIFESVSAAVISVEQYKSLNH